MKLTLLRPVFRLDHQPDSLLCFIDAHLKSTAELNLIIEIFNRDKNKT